MSSAVAEGLDSFRIEKTFRSPTNGKEIVVVQAPSMENTPGGEFVGAIKNGEFIPAKNLANSIRRRDYHGIGWITQTQYITQNWINGRYLVIEDQDGIFVADSIANAIIVDGEFAGYAKSPTAWQWAAVRSRASGRGEDTISPQTNDTLILIDSALFSTILEKHVPEEGRDDPFDSFVEKKTGAIVIYKPIWSDDGATVTVITWKNGKCEAIVYDGKNLHELVRKTLSLTVSQQNALYPLTQGISESDARNALQQAGLMKPAVMPNR